MVKCMSEFRLYIFAFDQLCEEILKEEKLKNVIVHWNEEFETPGITKS